MTPDNIHADLSPDMRAPGLRFSLLWGHLAIKVILLAIGLSIVFLASR